METERLSDKKNLSVVITCLSLMSILSSLTGCVEAMVEPDPVPDPVPVIEIYSGFNIQLTASSGVQWGSENPSVATVSLTGLVTAVSAGKTSIYTFSTDTVEKNIVCHLEVNPRRNILFYIATDADASIDNDVPDKINEIRAGWRPGQGDMLIYADRRGKGAYLMRLNETLSDGKYGLDTLESYGIENSADAATLNRVIKKVTQDYPADSYGMIFFSHASGWLPSGTLNYPRSLAIDEGGQRFEIEYTDFAAAIPDKQFDFIIFEACLMADALAMYELRNKADYVLVSSAEIVAPGFTYIYQGDIMRLFDTRNDVATVVAGFAQAFHNCITTLYPETNVRCSSTLGVIKMSEMQNLASVVKTTLKQAEMNEVTLAINEIQAFDRVVLISSGQRRRRYFDLGHVMEKLVSPSEYATFCTQMDKTVIWKASTQRFLYGQDGFSIIRHCGLTTYIQQSVYPYLNTAFENSAWFKAIYE